MRDNREWKKVLLERVSNFAMNIIRLSDKLPKSPAGFAIASQVIRSATSIGANIVEAQDASSIKDFTHKLSISLREARETSYWLTVIKKATLLNESEIEKDIKECDELIAILVTSIKSSKAKFI